MPACNRGDRRGDFFLFLNREVGAASTEGAVPGALPASVPTAEPSLANRARPLRAVPCGARSLDIFHGGGASPRRRPANSPATNKSAAACEDSGSRTAPIKAPAFASTIRYKKSTRISAMGWGAYADLARLGRRLAGRTRPSECR